MSEQTMNEVAIGNPVWIEQPSLVNKRRRSYSEELVRYWLAIGSDAIANCNNGAVKMSYEGVGEKTGLTPKQVRNVINGMKKRGEIEVKRIQHGLMITLFDYREWRREVGIEMQAKVENKLRVVIRYGVNLTAALAFTPEVARIAWSPEQMVYAE